ncbi:hypothetical protein [Kribbella solani]|uniref:hypothetical protein n=1 Tax=Kribbella solani TaxID=236067 RepID=UPI0029B42A65|nr:hypothetical protein [Kribbella solani]MDX2972650.1 hypothetical protein [Kribbella solani]
MQRKVFCASAPSDVYRAVSTANGRERFWADAAPETNGVIAFRLADGRTDESRINDAVQDQRYQLRHFGRTLSFTLTPGEGGGTDLTLESDDPADCVEVVALLLRLKALVDFGVDLRNHDGTRTHAYADS